jgi:thioredoxin-related protein
VTVSRRTTILLTLGPGLALLGPVRLAQAASHTLPLTAALNDDLARAVRLGKPLIVMVSLEGCPFCRVVRETYLPSVTLEQGIPVVQVDIGKPTALHDLHSRPTTHDQLTQAWGIRVAPTLLFFGKNGNEVAERLVGAATSDFYGVYLQQRIDKALRSFT